MEFLLVMIILPSQITIVFIASVPDNEFSFLGTVLFLVGFHFHSYTVFFFIFNIKDIKNHEFFIMVLIKIIFPNMNIKYEFLIFFFQFYRMIYYFQFLRYRTDWEISHNIARIEKRIWSLITIFEI